MLTMLRSGSTALVALSLCAMSGVAVAQQQKELSDKSVTTVMNYAWLILPSKFTTPTGKVIEVDKKNKKAETMVPIETAREVIKVGYTSAHAQLCEMWEEQVVNYDAMMRTEQAKKKWTEQQLLYITTLHRMTIHMAAGKLKVTDKGENQDLLLELLPIEPTKDTCNDERRNRVKEIVAAAAKSAPPPPARAAAPPTTPATGAPAAQPVPASATDQKKK